jgi:hypothetical protein
MRGFAKLLKDIDNIKRQNNASNQEMSVLLAKISNHYRERAEPNQRKRLISETKDKIETALTFVEALEAERGSVFTHEAREVITDIGDYLDEIEKYS